jgi:hypothetical protein
MQYSVEITGEVWQQTPEGAVPVPLSACPAVVREVIERALFRASQELAGVTHNLALMGDMICGDE